MGNGSAGKLRLSRLFFYNGGMERSLSIEPLTADHWEAVRSIYLQGIATGNATFQQTVPGWEEWDAGHLRTCSTVARSEQDIVGWAALSPAPCGLYTAEWRKSASTWPSRRELVASEQSSWQD